MKALIARLEASTEGSRQLDGEIACVVYKAIGARAVSSSDVSYIEMGPDEYGSMKCPHYTTSVDEALTLVPEGWGTSHKNTHEYNDNMWQWGLWRFSNLQEVSSVCVKKNPALAICLAAFKAKQEENES